MLMELGQVTQPLCALVSLQEKKKNKNNDNNIFIALLWWIDKIICAKQIEKCLQYSMQCTSVSVTVSSIALF